MSSLRDEVERRPGGHLVEKLAVAWMLLGIFPVFPQIFGAGFLPSMEWIANSSSAGIVAGLISGALLFWFTIRGIDKIAGGDFKKACVIMTVPFFGYFMCRNAAVVIGPMILGLIAGHQVELPFTVANADHSGSRGCRSPLELEGLPFLFDRLCGVPNDLRRDLGPGRNVVVIGRGTSFGVFAKGFHSVG